MDTVKDKVAVVTGGASGVGLALAQVLAREGAKLVIADIEQAALDTAIEGLKASGADVVGLRTDVCKRDQVAALADLAWDTYGRVDMLFNNAGVGGGTGQPLWETTEQNYRWTFDVNFFGPLNGIHVFLPRLIAQGGEALISVTSSAAGLVFPKTSPAYSGSKAAVIALWEVLAFQLAEKHPEIKTAILFPGPHVVNTRLLSAARNLQADYDDPRLAATGQAMLNMNFKQVMQHVTGHEVEMTEPEDFAEEALQSVLRGDFYVLPLNDALAKGIDDRAKAMLERGAPIPLDVT